MHTTSYAFFGRDPELKNKQRELADITEQLQQLDASIADKRQQQAASQQQLKQIDLRIGQTAAKIKKLQKQQQQQQSKLEKLQQQQEHLQQDYIQDLKAISAYAQSHYLMGNASKLRLLLNQTDLSQAARQLKYYSYMSTAHAKHLQALQNSSQALLKSQTDYKSSLQALVKLQQDSFNKEKELNKLSEKQGKFIKKLAQEIHSDEAKQADLSASAEELKMVLNAIKPTRNNVFSRQAAITTFDDMRGRLAWPVTGTIAEQFGNRRGNSLLTWNGDLLQTQTGADVHAVYGGRVVFANWLRGLGLLIIVDHGNGYMSLYGHNQNLYKQAGDTVKAGETIAAAGHSGGLNQTALYFEIRKNGLPLNPAHWCQKING